MSIWFALQIAPGLVIKKDMQVWTPITASHYCEDFFPEPEKFKPERFLKENSKDFDPITFRPFGGKIFTRNELKNCTNTNQLFQLVRACASETASLWLRWRSPRRWRWRTSGKILSSTANLPRTFFVQDPRQPSHTDEDEPVGLHWAQPRGHLYWIGKAIMSSIKW